MHAADAVRPEVRGLVDASDTVLMRLTPLAAAWVKRTLHRHARTATPVGEMGFERLPEFFSSDLLCRACVVQRRPVPMPPLARLLTRLTADPQPALNPAGITYRHMYFLPPEMIHEESIHFHELIHVIQWEQLGVEPFLLAYAKGYMEHGYADCPLEEMAFRHERRFESGEPPYDVEAEIRREVERDVKPVVARYL